MTATLRDQWQRLGARDQRMLKLGAGLAGSLLFWAWVWDPLSASRAMLREQAAANEADLAWMRPAVERVAAQGGIDSRTLPQADGRSLLAQVDASARESGLGPQLTGIEPQGEQRVRLQFSGADFDQLTVWLESLASRRVRVEELAITRAAGSGRVDARVALLGAAP